MLIKKKKHDHSSKVLHVNNKKIIINMNISDLEKKIEDE